MALPPTQAPAAGEYAGDEISALVLDCGSCSTRAGFAGEDTPKSVVPTNHASLSSGERLFGENAIHLPRADVEIRNPYNADGLVEDWDTASKLWEYTVTSRLTGARQTPPTRNGLNDDKDENGDVNMEQEAERREDEQDSPLAEYPLLMTEQPWNPVKAREKTMELAMEEWGVPAFFLAKNGQLAAYSQGKATALVVDVGHQNTSVTALWEGMVLKKSLHHAPLAGNWLNNQIRAMFATQQPPVPLVPHYMVKTKQPVDANSPSNATYVQFAKPPPDSFRRLEEERVLTAFKESVVQAWHGPGRLEAPPAPHAPNGFSNLDHVRSLPPRPFEMPDGWNTVFGADRFKVVESLFDTRAAYPSSDQPTPKPEDAIPSLVNRAVSACDVDTRPHLLNNIILTGAGSLIEKLPDRLQTDVQAMFPNPKVRVLANSNAVERKFGAWVGGSVLASLGTFHQMWVSRQEYEEFGAGVVEKRCK
ncbi:NuA4 histone acetyltransferase subunit [Saxophila tyrrhenica]|uniref:NuA4 histone acetyltransferase subunit n=1 Tax=Saxophila tyrrhenica TaxID=1690608 RepID=A0AAV9PGY3_9PEZI|nr:NuA4 histone acetyltransferase subunit [Saxophila tyrrhenica]